MIRLCWSVQVKASTPRSAESALTRDVLWNSTARVDVSNVPAIWVCDARMGYVVYGPPQRPLDQIVLQMRSGGQVWAVGKRTGRNAADYAKALKLKSW